MSNSQVIYINSSEPHRDAGTTNEDFTITKQIQEFTNTPKKIKLISACIPFTWDNVITGINNTFTVYEDGIGSVNIIIPQGYYSGSDLASTIANSMNTTLTQTYDVTYNSKTLMFYFSTGDSAGFQFTMTPDIMTLLGFTDSVYPSSPITSFSSQIKAVLLVDYEILICSDAVRGSDNGVITWYSNSVPSISQDNILARVPINSCFTSVINYSAYAELPYYICKQSRFIGSSNTLSSIRFYLTFPSGRPVNLNGYHWTAEIILQF